MRPEGPPGWPPRDRAVFDALDACFQGGYWGSYVGRFVGELEERLAADWGVPHALTCGSGTFGVELALRALKVGPGDEVILAAYDYPGNFLSVHAVGATPVLVDVDAESAGLAPASMGSAVSPATKAVIVSHLHGGIVPMREVVAVARQHHLRVVEDACQCPGAVIEGRKAGTWGDVGVLSFGGSKLLTAGRGARFLTPHADVYQRAKVANTRGNVVCPLSELQAAVVLPQLTTLPERHRKRLAAVRWLTERLQGVPGLRPFRNRTEDAEAGYYKVGFWFDADEFGLDRKRFTAAVRAEGVALDEGFRTLHGGRSASRFRLGGPVPNADRAGQAVVILHHPVLLEGEAALEQVALAIEKVHRHRDGLRGF